MHHQNLLLSLFVIDDFCTPRFIFNSKNTDPLFGQWNTHIISVCPFDFCPLLLPQKKKKINE